MAVGEHFIAVRNDVVKKQNLGDDEWLLAQGTLYPDIIESGGTKNSKTIKTHHNRVEGIQKLIEKGLVIEPIRDLYKDEVRAIGKKLGLSDELVMRHPFPGPGLSINVLCSTGQLDSSGKAEFEKAQAEFDAMKITAFCESCTADLKKSVLPVKSVGVQGDFRTYKFPAVLSFKKDENGFYHVPQKWEKIEAASSSITNSASFLNRTVLKLWQRPSVKDEDLQLQEGYCDKFRLDQLREIDDIVLTFLHKSSWYSKIFQHLTIDLPFASKKENASFVLRPVVSEDVMTARFAKLDLNLLRQITEEIAKREFVDALFFDATNKPPATFGWE